MKVIAPLTLLSSASAVITYDDAMNYLATNLPSYDKTNAASLGFPSSNSAVDGLNDGVASVGTNVSLTTRYESGWKWAGEDVVPDEIFLEFVLPYASVNEGRTNWRPMFLEKLTPLLSGDEAKDYGTEDVVGVVNDNLWSMFDNKTIVFKSR